MSKPATVWRKSGVAGLATAALLGTSVLTAGTASADADFAFERIAGDNRYETAGEVYDAFGPSDSVILANGEQGHFPDALVANYLAGVEGSPILLTRADKMPDATDSRLSGGGKDITIIGGTGVVSAAQEASLEADGNTVTRIAGDNRYTTAAEVIEAGGDAASNTAIITTGVDFPDALAGGPVSVDQGSPIAISRANDIRDEEVDALVASGVENFIVLGGPTIVGAPVIAELEAAGLSFEDRIFGADRAETSVALAEYAVDNYGFTDQAVNVASGYIAGTGADALAGGPLTGQDARPLLITRSNTNPGATVDYLGDHCPALMEGNIFGGTGAVDSASEAEMEAAAQSCVGTGNTARPEMVGATILDTNSAGELGTDGTTVRFTFDEALATATNGTPPTASLFHVYNQAGMSEDGNTVTNQSGNTVTVRFNNVDTDTLAAALTVATVDKGAVFDPSPSDLANPIGDAALGSTSGGGTVNLPAGITNGPDLMSVGSFTADGANTEVAFTFDEAATTGLPAEYHLIGTDGSVVDGNTVDGGNNTTTHIVEFTGTLSAGDFARGTVDAGSVDETTDNEGDLTDSNVLQAADISNGGNSGDPDLVSVSLQEGPATGEDRALFTFDEGIAEIAADAGPPAVLLSPNPALFFLYKDDGSRNPGITAEVNPGNNTQVLVTFDEGAIDRAVGGQTEADAVTGTDTNQNEDDEVGVANTGSTSGRTAGKTDGPDLTGVTTEQRKDLFGNVVGADATFTFDEAVNTPVNGKFLLYLADGTEITGGTCAVDDNGTAGDTTDDTNVVCEFTGPAGNLDQANNAVLGTVDDAAVTADDAGPSNPEGASAVS